jgi:hypothetical protein
VTRSGDGVGAARTSRADSSYALRNVRWTIAMSRTLIGCDADIYVPPYLDAHCAPGLPAVLHRAWH